MSRKSMDNLEKKDGKGKVGKVRMGIVRGEKEDGEGMFEREMILEK